MIGMASVVQLELLAMWNPFGTQARDRGRCVSVESGRPALHAGDTRHYEIAEVEMIGEIAVATITMEELTLEGGVMLLADMLDDLVASGIRHLVLDIQNVRYMDSACVGCMVETLNKLTRSGGRIALANPASSVAYLFRLTRLDRVFPICGNAMAAVNTIERTIRSS
jgi:anti-sigma B factor antagonist